MYFSFSFVAKKRERKVPKERENTLPLPTLLRAFYKIDIAGKACSLTFAKKRSRRECRSFEKIIMDCSALVGEGVGVRGIISHKIIQVIKIDR
mgnify:CR=1 FL=1